MLKEYKAIKKVILLLNFTSAISSKRLGFMLVLLSVILRSVELNFDSIEVDVGKRQKIAFAWLHRIGKAFFISRKQTYIRGTKTSRWTRSTKNLEEIARKKFSRLLTLEIFFWYRGSFSSTLLSEKIGPRDIFSSLLLLE